MLFQSYKRAEDTWNDSVVLQENLETICAATQDERGDVNFVLLSRSRMFFRAVRKSSFKWLATRFRAWAGMWASIFQKSVLRTELRSTLEQASVLPRLLFCVSTIMRYLNRKESNLQRTELRNGKPGFQTLLGIRTRDVNVGCSSPRQILELSSASLSLALQVLRVYLWDPSLGIRFSCQQMNGSPQLWLATDLPSRKWTAAELSSWELTSWSRSYRGACLSFYCGVKSIEMWMAAF